MSYNETRKEFLESRRSKIGASDAPIIMEMSPFKTPYKLWREKVGLDQSSPLTERMKRGLELEPLARESFEKKVGFKVFPHRIEHKDYKWMIASLDGIDFNGEHFVEIKCPGKIDHDMALNGKIPEKYLPQLQHQLFCTNLQCGFYYSFDGQDGVILEIQRDDSLIKTIVGKEADFFKCMNELIPPALSEKDFIEKNDFEWMVHSKKYQEYKNKIEDLEQKLEKEKNCLINMADKKNCKGYNISITNVVRKGNIDYNSIPELENVNLEKYRRNPVQYSKISIHKE